jgi:hypothetical protein
MARQIYTKEGNEGAVELGQRLFESLDENQQAEFREDNNMTTGADLYTTVLANFIWYKSYNDFKKYFELVWNLTPKDLGLPAGAGVYKIPKVRGAVGAKIADGEVVSYTNDLNESVLLETYTYAVGTKITRRLIKRGAMGFIQKKMSSASDAALRVVCKDIANGLVNGAAAANNQEVGISMDAIADAELAITTATDSTTGELIGFKPNVLAFSSTGWNVFKKSNDYKTLVTYNQMNPGQEVNTGFFKWNSGTNLMDVTVFELISATKNSKVTHAVVYDKDNFFCFLKETDLETYDGRLPGTAGDMETIMAIDAGMVVMNDTAASVITAA